MIEEIVKTDEELDNEYYDFYCKLIHNQKIKLTEQEEYNFQKWFDENEYNLIKLRKEGYTDRALFKKAYILGLGKND